LSLESETNISNNICFAWNQICQTEIAYGRSLQQPRQVLFTHNLLSQVTSARKRKSFVVKIRLQLFSTIHCKAVSLYNQMMFSDAHQMQWGTQGAAITSFRKQRTQQQTIT